jgi:hypothetical protein
MTSRFDDDRFDPQDDARVAAPGADPDCRCCGGAGYVTDWVDYGSARVPMRTGCECVQEEDDGQPSDLQEHQDFAHDDDPPDYLD